MKSRCLNWVGWIAAGFFSPPLQADVRPVPLATLSPLTDAGYGAATDITGNTAVITATGGADGINSFGTEVAHVFTRDAGSGAWSLSKQIGPLLPPGEQIGNFGASVAVDGDTVAVGAPVLFSPGSASGYDGRVFIHKRNTGGTGNWGRVKLLAGQIGGDKKYGFGDRVVLAGDTLAVRTVGNRAALSTVRIFLRNQGGAEQWGEVATIVPPVTTPGGVTTLSGDDFAAAMALDGDRLVCGLPEEGSTPSAAGVYIYERSMGGPNAWGLARWIRPSDIPGARLLGHTVALEGDRLLVSGVGEVGGQLTTRVWWLLRTAAGIWEVESAQSIVDPAVSGFGRSVALSGDWAAVAAVRQVTADSRRQDVWLYQRTSGSWSQNSVLLGPAYPGERSTGTLPPGLPPEFVELRMLQAMSRSLVPFPATPLAMGGAALLHRSSAGSSGTTGGLSVRERTAGGGAGWGSVGVLRPSSGMSESFGESMAAAGNWLAVGDPDDDEGAIDSGAVWLFQRNTVSIDRWYATSKIKAPVPQAGAHFGAALALLAHGLSYTLAVGAPEAVVSTVTSGGVYTFGGYGDGLTLAPLVPSANQAFGRAVALTALRNPAGNVVGARLAVGASGHDLAGAVNAGKVEIQEFFGGYTSWSRVRTLTAGDAAANDAFGWSVAIDGDTVAVGALTAGADGAAYVFQRAAGPAHEYPQVKKILPGDGSSGLFPSSLALEGDVLVGGTLSLLSGAAFIYERNQGGANQWGFVKKLRPIAPGGSSDGFGLNVALHNDLILVGAAGDDAVGTNSGAAWLFQKNRGGENQWAVAVRLPAAAADVTRLHGQAVAIANDSLIVGAPNDDEAGLDLGAATVVRVGSYEFWAEAQALIALPAGGSDPASDPDGDGDTNLVEFMLGTNPRNSASRTQPMMSFNPATRMLSLAFAKPPYSQAGLKIEGEGRTTAFGSFSFSDAEILENSATAFSAQWRDTPPAGALLRVKATYPSW